ncbi:hypothetical protein EMIHUDRAFT_468238 [Emiliania huxleyi CCMP1516]|uniref:CS domain-containing protein n=2 Tax=Emiliania huxleyi TaxID=2903 RepID=A0A0D3K6F5_EMIH1|nr:hypothetical protein EMIHUDRAFT_468238 [Emiliania huxleyi CCMP1516]EOD31340.1 hypothetical protein EMIHUDRAFT_468238 [Emiliania huxleyi CCMP1516]|eukprot:XP_005783769.1 hypothetical protein EMIHUDRAFT_468238 [Emiliania huxleyi CCMP1516]
MVVWTLLPCDKSNPPQPREVASLGEARAAVDEHLGASKFASKERCDLAAVEAHTGTSYAQALTVPDDVYAALKALNGAAALVLLPPNSTGLVVGSDSVVLMYDRHGGLKGLPPNERASLLTQAAGQPRAVRGDCFVGRLAYGPPAAGQLRLGGEAAPQLLTERGWLEAAQAAAKAAAKAAPTAAPTAAAAGGSKRGSSFGAAVEAWLAEGRREKVAAAVSAAAPPPPPCAQRLLDGAAAAGEAAAGGAAAGGAAAGEAAAGGGGELSWEDGGEEVTVRVTLPAGTKSRDAADCEWHIEDGPGSLRTLTLSLEKKRKMRWVLLTRND